MYGKVGDRFIIQRRNVGNFAVGYGKVVLWEYQGYNIYHDEFDEPAEITEGDFLYPDYVQAIIDENADLAPVNDYEPAETGEPAQGLLIKPVNPANGVSGGVFA